MDGGACCSIRSQIALVRAGEGMHRGQKGSKGCWGSFDELCAHSLLSSSALPDMHKSSRSSVRACWAFVQEAVVAAWPEMTAELEALVQRSTSNSQSGEAGDAPRCLTPLQDSDMGGQVGVGICALPCSASSPLCCHAAVGTPVQTPATRV